MELNFLYEIYGYNLCGILKKLNKINSCLPSKAGCVMLHDLKKT